MCRFIERFFHCVLYSECLLSEVHCIYSESCRAAENSELFRPNFHIDPQFEVSSQQKNIHIAEKF